ncbi:MAG: hypothetical protein JXM70_02800, partial [Pirellulales bacterium]|nr:hypothetical protein [Pirellulales bacterium]
YKFAEINARPGQALGLTPPMGPEREEVLVSKSAKSQGCDLADFYCAIFRAGKALTLTIAILLIGL